MLYEVITHGGGDERWEEIAKIISDCRALLVGGAGKKPISILGKRNNFV